MIEVAGGILLAFLVLAFLPVIATIASVLALVAVALAGLGVAWYLLFVKLPGATAEEVAVSAFFAALAVFIVWLNYRAAKQENHEASDVVVEPKVESRPRDSKGRFLKRGLS